MALPSNISVRPLVDDGMGPNGQGTIRPARNAVQQFLMNVFGTWQQGKPQLLKDAPALDMITPQVAYATGQGSAQEAMAGFGGPASIRGGLQYGRYGKNAMNYGANRGVQASAKQSQNFITAQTENIVRNPGKPGTGTPSAPFSFTTQATAQPSASQAFTQLSKAEAGSFMGGLKPGSVEPVIPWTTKARIAGIDATNAVKSTAGKVVSGTKSAATKHVGIPLKNAANFMKPQNKEEWKALGYISAGGAGAVGAGAYVIENNASKSDKLSEEKKFRDRIYAIPGETKKSNSPVKSGNTKAATPIATKNSNPTTPKAEQKAKVNSPVVNKQSQPTTSTKTKTSTTVTTKPGTNNPSKVTPKVALPANKQTIQAEKVVQTTSSPEQPWNSDLQSAEHLAINSERRRLGGESLQTLKPLSGNIQTQQTTSLAQSHPRVLSPQVSKAQLAADAIFTKGRVMGFKRGGILKVKSNG